MRKQMISGYESFLEPIGTITIPPITEPFAVRDKFVRNVWYSRDRITGVATLGIDPDVPVKIFGICDDFTHQFSNRTEPPVDEVTLQSFELRGPLSRGDASIVLLDLRGEEAKVSLGQIFWLMEQQPDGGPGPLAVAGSGVLDNHVNTFFVSHVPNDIYWQDIPVCAVDIQWYGWGWFVYALELNFPRCSTKRRIFTPTST